MTCCDLPDSIEYLGNHALDTWEPEHVESSPKTMDIINFHLSKKPDLNFERSGLEWEKR